MTPEELSEVHFKTSLALGHDAIAGWVQTLNTQLELVSVLRILYLNAKLVDGEYVVSMRDMERVGRILIKIGDIPNG